MAPLPVLNHLSHGVDAFDEAGEDDAPGAAQTHHDPPLQRTAILNVVRDVEGLTVPEVVDRGALLTLQVKAWRERRAVGMWSEFRRCRLILNGI